MAACRGDQGLITYSLRVSVASRQGFVSMMPADAQRRFDQVLGKARSAELRGLLAFIGSAEFASAFANADAAGGDTPGA